MGETGFEEVEVEEEDIGRECKGELRVDVSLWKSREKRWSVRRRGAWKRGGGGGKGENE